MSPTQQRRGRLLRPTIAVDAVFAAVAAVVLLKDLTLGRFGPRQHPQEVRRRRDLLLERPYRCNKWSGPERDGRTSHCVLVGGWRRGVCRFNVNIMPSITSPHMSHPLNDYNY